MVIRSNHTILATNYVIGVLTRQSGLLAEGIREWDGQENYQYWNKGKAIGLLKKFFTLK